MKKNKYFQPSYPVITCLPKRLFYSEPAGGKHSQGGHKKCYKDTLKASLKSFGIDLTSGKP